MTDSKYMIGPEIIDEIALAALKQTKRPVRVMMDVNQGIREVNYCGLEDVFGDYEQLKKGDPLIVMFMCSDSIADATVDHWFENEKHEGLVYFTIDRDSVRSECE